MPPHDWSHAAARLIGFEAGDTAPQWVHLVLHVVLVVAPLALALVAISLVIGSLRHRRTMLRQAETQTRSASAIRYVLRSDRRDQFIVVLLGLLALPLLYATLELPKQIVNGAIESGHFPVIRFGLHLDQLDLLVLLSGFYLMALVSGGCVKYMINVRKGIIGERILRRLRLQMYRAWHRLPPRHRKTDVIPLGTQEIEPIGGFAGDVLATPVFQGGTLATVMLFMFVQDPILGAAAMTLVPVHLAIVPILQRRVNLRMRHRIRLVRELGAELGRQTDQSNSEKNVALTTRMFRHLHDARLDIQRAKYLQKAVSNFLMALTPFLLYSIGGWLVIEGRLSLGALVAVIVAFKDFSAPFRELLRYYQSLSDVQLRFAQFNGFIAQAARPVILAERANHRQSRLQLVKGSAN